MKHSEVSTITGVSGKWEEAFREFMDQIYWEGYSQQLVKDDPEAYQREYYYFLALYDEPIYNGAPVAQINPKGIGTTHE